jgi:hypothetical protein
MSLILRRLLLLMAFLVAPSLAFAGDHAFTLTTTPTAVVAAGYHTLIAVDNESVTVALACSFIGTPAVNTAGSWTILPGQTRTWTSNSRTAVIPKTALQCVAASTTAAMTLEND